MWVGMPMLMSRPSGSVRGRQGSLFALSGSCGVDGLLTLRCSSQGEKDIFLPWQRLRPAQDRIKTPVRPVSPSVACPSAHKSPFEPPCPDDPPANPFVVNTNDVIHPIPLSDPPLPHRARFRSLPPPRRTGIDRGRRRPWRRRRRYCGIFMAWLPINFRQIDSWRPPTPTPTLNRWQTLHHDHNIFASRLGQRDLVAW